MSYQIGQTVYVQQHPATVEAFYPSHQDGVDFYDLKFQDSHTVAFPAYEITAEPRVGYEKPDNINSPAHYTQGKYEVIDIIQASMSHEGFQGYLLGNMTKYLLRCQHKHQDGGSEDLKKLIWYAEKYIANIRVETA
ncbi:DUF3310 domain-containing protein [Streptomyces sp. IMTB 2501]|uniref:DUF3310 domain-containing protein n=1 Tax=Streptomyces sp. IMTB 2501 TaxID=1776340 RepID=UPI0009A22CC6|nr:DUF3310 domain-containing protein [Streptomyces sp. IMTB 2501]